MRRAQGAIEYLFMLAAVLIIVLVATRVVLNGVRNMDAAIEDYITQVRQQILENL
ncbi:class III signal peptide-containing protein [Thermococcus sp. M36]|uniref:class III signal peptide-containing protein n=1 Tax=Thermococcus sp. M36 TaxID=1638261 RepID=UPI0014393791|nr:class III signal peptide-containing protein [Thermococcus sp. M36]NJE04974.1 class III signal peptide-containing protein [Thermococcus sp. M36]